ncbi:hypothetical protein SAMN04515620_11696 [Collimonas sp. OK607]|uniref:hypothetical protein n=1 Tax=Collimonas sp. OK607 TaxID=1798194 RepID=UPI0008EADF7D|nr:hypothetical protein [Collimonas sp. OK607]SFB08330.1 hypothetical protein SAMN04515620_11696 [Collimonas sp. OK607]
MNSETDIQLSGPFSVTDATGRSHNINAIRIFDEGYGIIDVYIDFAAAIGKDRLYEDKVLIAQILAQLRKIGYVGPDFGHGDLGLQDDKLIVLEAPEEFNAFAASKGWKNLADEFAEDDYADESYADDADNSNEQAASISKLDALKNKFKS